MIVLEILPAYRERAKQKQRDAGREHGRGQIASGRSSGSYSGDAPAPRSTGDEARDEAASKFGVSGRTVASLDRVRREAPDLFEQVKAGEKSISAADGEVGLVPTGRGLRIVMSHLLHAVDSIAANRWASGSG